MGELEAEAFDVVVLGAEMLESHKPGSVAKLDVENLDVWCAERCPAGQVFGSFFEAPQELQDRAFDYGFAVRGLLNNTVLGVAWKLVANAYAEEAFYQSMSLL